MTCFRHLEQIIICTVSLDRAPGKVFALLIYRRYEFESHLRKIYFQTKCVLFVCFSK